MRGRQPRIVLDAGTPVLSYQEPWGTACIHRVGQPVTTLGPGFTPYPIGNHRWLYLDDKNQIRRVTLGASGFSQTTLPVPAALAEGAGFIAGGNKWANVRTPPGRLVVDGKVLIPDLCGAAVGIGHRFVACPHGANGSHALRIRIADGTQERFKVQAPLFELSLKDGWIVYGGGANTRLMAIGPQMKPGDTHEDVTIVPWKAEGAGVACMASRRLWIWSSTGRGQIAGRPMGSATAILFDFPAEQLDVIFDSPHFHVAASSGGQLFYQAVRRNAARRLVA